MPSFLDEFEPRVSRQAAPSASAPNGMALINMDATQRWGRFSVTRAREQATHYTEWNYVAIQQIAWRFSELCPYVGQALSGPARPNSRQRLSYAQAQNLQRNYRAILQSVGHADIEPVSLNHPLSQLFSSVNDQDWWGAFAFEAMMWLELTGRLYLWLIPSGIRSRNGVGYQPAQMHVIPSTWVTPYFESRGAPQTGWEIVPDGDYTRREVRPLEEIEFVRYKGPFSKFDGHSAQQAGARWTEAAESIDTSRVMQFRNGGNPDLLVELDPEHYSNPDPDLIQRIKERVMQRSTGLKRHGEPLIAPPGVKYSKWSNTPREMDYADSGNQARDQVLGLRGVPKVLAGITEDVNRAAIEGANIIFGQNLNPKAAFLAGALTERVASRFGTGLIVWFDDAVPTDSADEREEVKIDLQYAAMSPDERRIQRGLPPRGTPAYQSGYLPSGMMPLDEGALPEPPASEAGPDTGEEPPADGEDTGNDSTDKAAKDDSEDS